MTEGAACRMSLADSGIPRETTDMARRLFPRVTCIVAGLAGCAEIRPDAKVNEAVDLVEQHTGQRPAWTVPWDEQPPPWTGQETLALDDALVMALRNNRELRADLEMIGQANADLVQAGLLQNPSFNFMLTLPDGGGRTMLRSNALPMMPLQDLWLIPARQEVATAQLQQAVLRVADRAVGTAASVKKVYARLQYTQRAIELIKENMQVVEQSTQIIQVRHVAGQATQVELTLSQIRYLRFRSELMTMEAEHRAAQRELLMLMGFASAPEEWRVAPLHEIRDPLDEAGKLPGESDVVRLAAEQRLDLKAAAWTAQAAERRIKLMQREGWPDLALAFTFERAPAPRSQNQQLSGKLGNAAVQGLADGLAGMSGPTTPMVAPFEPKMREVKYMMGPMIEMEIPIFDRNQAQVARALHEYRQRAAEYAAREQEITRMVRETFVMLRQAQEQVQFYQREILPAVERNLTLARQSYVAGREDLTIYLQAQEDLLMTRLRTLGFLRDCLVYRAELERQVGGRLHGSMLTTQPTESLPR